jgi:uncharacterized repeat protein (TIGR03803 family)
VTLRTNTLATMIAAAVLVALATSAQAQPRYEKLHTFSGDRGHPVAAPTEGPDGKLYGTTRFGGFSGKGTIYVADAGGHITILHEFTGPDGESPDGRLLVAPDGMLYGTTLNGGSGFGTVFRLNPDGSAFEVVVEFTGANGLLPRSGLVLGSDGALYGTTNSGGPTDAGAGTIFRLTTAGEFSTIVSFSGGDGASPSGDLFPVADGFYGTTTEGGAGFGTVFHAGLDGIVTTVVAFDGLDGGGTHPADGVILASDDNLYGTTSGGGVDGVGTVFRIVGTELETLHSFSGIDGFFPAGALRQLSDNHIYGTTSSGGSAGAGTVFRVALDGTFSSFVSFTFTNGSSPAGGVIEASGGAVYGTTEGGGTGFFGTVFELTPDALIRTVVPFSGATIADPSGGLVRANDGNLYGIAFSGGSAGVGAVYRVSPDGTVTVLASFDSSDELLATGALVQASDGHLYGTAEGGVSGNGGVFRVTLDGTVTTVGLFDFEKIGAAPSGRLIEGSDRHLYGTLLFGANGAPGGVFRLDPASGTITAVGTFAEDGSHGILPEAGLVEAPDGSFYGTARMGGANGLGTIFRVANNAISAVASFDGVNGADPASPLVIGSDGHVYGTTAEGGAGYDPENDRRYGTLFRLELDALDGIATLSTLVSFDGLNGWWPFQQGVVESTPGVFVGTTTAGGEQGLGTAYQWSEAGGLLVLHQFSGESGERPNATLIKGPDASLYGTTFGPQGGAIFRLVTDKAEASLSLAPASAIYGGSTIVSAALTSSGAAIANAEVSFALSGAPLGSAVTNDAGVATLPGISVAGLNAGTYTGVLQASFAGTDAVRPASAVGDLLIARADASVVVQNATFTYDGQPHPATGTATGAGGEALGPLTFTYNGSPAAPVDPGTYEVLASFAGNTNHEPASASATLTILPAPAGLDGLVAAYGFNEGGGSIAGDASGRGHAGRIKQAQWSAGGKFGGALDFDGTNDWVTIRDAAALDIRNAITIEAWVNPRTLSGWNTIVLKESDDGLAYALYANDSLPQSAGYVNVGGADRSVTSLQPLQVDAWTHVAMTYNGSLMRLYIGGFEVKRRSLTGRILSTDGALRIGGNSVWGEYFDGLIDEVRIYNRALSMTEIRRDMNMPVAHERIAPSVRIVSPADGDVLSGVPTVAIAAEDNFMLSNVQLQANGIDAGKPLLAAPFSTRLDLANGTYVLTAIARDMAGNYTVSNAVTVTIANAAVAAYDFEEVSGAVATDGSGQNNHGVLSRGVSRTSDVKRGRVLSFNGVDGFVSVPATESLALRTSMTLEAWVRPTALSGWRTVILKERPDGLSYALYANDSAPWPAGTVHIEGDGDIDRSVQGRESLPLYTWTHLAMSYDGAMLRLFVNGVEVASRAQTGAVEVSDRELRIGGNTVWGEWFRGQIDAVRIYGVALGEAQITADMKR